MELRKKQIKLMNGKTLILTSPKIENAQEIADYYNRVVAETRFLSADIKDVKETVESQEKSIKENIIDKKSLDVIAVIDGQIVGIGNVNPKRNNKVRYRHVCLIGVSVLKQFWGLGIASFIMIELIEFAKKSGFEQIELNVVSTNESAIHLYKKFGFVEEGCLSRAMKYTDGSYADLISMQKFLIENKQK